MQKINTLFSILHASGMKTPRQLQIIDIDHFADTTGILHLGFLNKQLTNVGQLNDAGNLILYTTISTPEHDLALRFLHSEFNLFQPGHTVVPHQFASKLLSLQHLFTQKTSLHLLILELASSYLISTQSAAATIIDQKKQLTLHPDCIFWTNILKIPQYLWVGATVVSSVLNIPHPNVHILWVQTKKNVRNCIAAIRKSCPTAVMGCHAYQKLTLLVLHPNLNSILQIQRVSQPDLVSKIYELQPSEQCWFNTTSCCFTPQCFKLIHTKHFLPLTNTSLPNHISSAAPEAIKTFMIFTHQCIKVSNSEPTDRDLFNFVNNYTDTSPNFNCSPETASLPFNNVMNAPWKKNYSNFIFSHRTLVTKRCSENIYELEITKELRQILRCRETQPVILELSKSTIIHGFTRKKLQSLPVGCSISGIMWVQRPFRYSIIRLKIFFATLHPAHVFPPFLNDHKTRIKN